MDKKWSEQLDMKLTSKVKEERTRMKEELGRKFLDVIRNTASANDPFEEKVTT